MKYFAVGLLLLLLTFDIKATPIVKLTNNINQFNITEKLEIYINKNKTVGFEQVMQDKFSKNFKAIEDVKNLYDTDIKQYWVKIKIKNESDFDKFLFTLDQWDYVEIYYKDKSGKIHFQKDGTLVKLGERPQNFGRLTYLALDLPKGEENTFYIKLSSKNKFDTGFRSVFQYFKRFNIDVYSNAEQNASYASYFFCFYIGLVFIITIYKAVLFLFTKDKAYLFFALYSFCMLIYIIIESGIGLIFFYPNNPSYSKPVLFFTLSMSFFFFTFFIQHYLHLKDLLPKWNIFYYFLGVGYFMLYILGVFVNSSFFVLVLLLNIVHNLSNLYVNIASVLKGFKPAMYFLVANIVFIFALLYNIALSVGTINQDFPILNLPLHSGNIFQIGILAIGLAYRVNILKQEAEAEKEEKRILIENQKKNLEEAVKRQTFHIQEQTEELQVQNEELKQTTEEVLAQRDFIEERNKLLEFKEKQIKQSIRSAEVIQQAILPYHGKFEQFFDDYFIINHPKDVVSGDFYWLTEVNNKIILVVADCTGHGVPGAFMTLIGANLLDKIVKLNKTTDPAKILDNLHIDIQSLLKQKYNKNNNGMDAIAIVLEKERSKTKLTFSGAKNNLLYWNKHELVELKATRKSIGGIQNEKIKFVSQSISLDKGDIVYLGSDGLEDQNNFKRKRFGRRRLKKLTEQIINLSLEMQKQRIEGVLKAHMQDTEQRDDILWMAFKV